MSLATINRSFERTGRGELYLAAAPSSVAGATLADKVKTYFGYFYTDTDGCKTLTNGVEPWANLTSEGLKVKVKQNSIEVDPNNGPKHSIGIQDTEMSGEIAFLDVDPAHLADAFSCTAEELIAQAAAAGKAGRSRVLLGGQASLVHYVGLYRMPSELVPGEYDHYLFPYITYTVDTDFDLNKKSAVICKLKFEAHPSPFLINNAGFGEQCIVDIASAPAV